MWMDSEYLGGVSVDIDSIKSKNSAKIGSPLRQDRFFLLKHWDRSRYGSLYRH